MASKIRAGLAGAVALLGGMGAAGVWAVGNRGGGRGGPLLEPVDPSAGVGGDDGAAAVDLVASLKAAGVDVPEPDAENGKAKAAGGGDPKEAVGADGADGKAGGAPAKTGLKLVDEAEIERHARQAERERIAGIDQRAALPRFAGDAKIVALANKAKAEQWTPEKFGDAAMQLSLAKPIGQQGGGADATGEDVAVGNTERQKYVDAYELAIAARFRASDLSDIETGGAGAGKQAAALGFVSVADAAKALAAVRASNLMGMSLMEIAAACVARQGGMTFGAALSMARNPATAAQFMRVLAGAGVSAGHTSADFARILSNEQNKAIQAAYDKATTVWQEFCAVGTATDYKKSRIIARGDVGRFVKRSGENAPGREQTIREANNEEVFVEGYTTGVSFTYEMLRNDDLGAFIGLVAEVAEEASEIPDDLFIEALLANSGNGITCSDNVALFNSAHQNVGTPAALSHAALVTERTRFRGIKNNPTNAADARFLNVMPDRMLVPPALEGTALELYRNEFIPSNANPALGERNQFSGTFRPIVSPKLTSATAYFFAVAPGPKSVIEIRFLDGQRAPRVDQITNGDPWEIAYKISVMGVGRGLRPRYYGIHRNAGA